MVCRVEMGGKGVWRLNINDFVDFWKLFRRQTRWPQIAHGRLLPKQWCEFKWPADFGNQLGSARCLGRNPLVDGSLAPERHTRVSCVMKPDPLVPGDRRRPSSHFLCRGGGLLSQARSHRAEKTTALGSQTRSWRLRARTTQRTCSAFRRLHSANKLAYRHPGSKPTAKHRSAAAE